MSKIYTTRGSGLRARKQPTTDAAVVGMFPDRSRLEVDHNVTVGEDIWHALPVSAGGVGLRDPGDIAAPAYLWAAHRYRGTDYTEAEAPPPPAVPFRLGVHAIGDVSAADVALAAGCPFVVIMDKKLETVQRARAYPAARLVYRKYLGGAWPTPAEMVAALGPFAGDPPISFVGLNEGDSAAETGTPAGILKRAAWDIEVATMIKQIQPNATYYAGSFGHGNPDITRPDICDAMRQGYAAAYNSGLLGFDLHNYTKGKRRTTHPPSDAIVVGPEWFERRADWFFTKCGFDPRIRRIIATETGVEAGHGGFNWANYTEQQYREWQADILTIMRAPLIVGGVSYPSPYEFATVFQFGSNSDWAGYDTRRYLGVMREGWV